MKRKTLCLCSIVTAAILLVAAHLHGANLTNGMVAYWPLDAMNGTRTPDLVSAYDMTLYNMGATNLIEGKWGQALSFNSDASQYATHIYGAGDALPFSKLPQFTLSLWTKGLGVGAWTLTEASTVNTGPVFALGTASFINPNLDMYMRDDNRTVYMNHVGSSTAVWDDNWHNIIWVQTTTDGTPAATLYIDGQQDATVPSPILTNSYNPNNTSLGAFVRATVGQYFSGAVDDVAVWNRALDTDEIAQLQTGPITNPPTRLSPLAINSFAADLPGIAQGTSTTLRWDVPPNATQIVISNLGDVTSQTVSGLGAAVVSPAKTTTYVLTVKRGLETITATRRINVVNAVAANWYLLDNFDSYQPGLLGAQGWWIDISQNGTAVTVAQPSTTSSNRVVTFTTNSSAASLNLKGLGVAPGQSRTLFFRIIPKGGGTADVVTHLAGLSDKQCNFYYQLWDGTGLGSAVAPKINDPTQNPGDWLISAQNGNGSGFTFAPNVLQSDATYSVWIDITNVAMVNPSGSRVMPDESDVFSVYIQKDGDASRTLLFANYVSDRALNSNDSLTGGVVTDTLNRLYLSGDTLAFSAYFDDFYLSQSGYNATIPVAAGYAGPPPAVSMTQSAGQWQVWFEGTLQHASSPAGTWSEVSGATSPYPVSTAGEMQFYRAVYH